MSGVEWPRDGPLTPVMRLMEAGFPPDFGERWSRRQLADLLSGDPASWLTVDRHAEPRAFALARVAADEAELMLLAVHPAERRSGLAGAVLAAVAAKAALLGAIALFAEVRDGNPAMAFYRTHGFQTVGHRPRYYRRSDGTAHDAITVRRQL